MSDVSYSIYRVGEYALIGAQVVGRVSGSPCAGWTDLLPLADDPHIRDSTAPHNYGTGHYYLMTRSTPPSAALPTITTRSGIRQLRHHL